MKKFQFNSLKTFLSATIGLIITIMTVILVILSYNSSYNSVKDAYINQLQNTSGSIDLQVTQFYDQQMNNTLFFSRNNTIISACETGRYDEALAMIKSFAQEHKIYANIFVSSAENNPVVLAGISGTGTKWFKQEYEENIRNNLNGAEYVSDPTKSAVTGLPIVLFSAPIKRGERVVGILGMAVNIGEFSNSIVNNIKIAKTGFPYIVANNGITIAHPNKEMILTLDLNKYDWGKRVLSATKGEIIEYTFNGLDKLIMPTKNSKYRITTGVTVGLADINDEARSLALKMIIFAFIAIILGAGATYMIISRRLYPLEKCRDVMKHMSEGNLSVRYEGQVNRDEIGEMSNALNATVNQFEGIISDIMVATQNLSQAVEQIASGNQNMSQRTAEQASSLEEIASTIEEAAATINQNTENATKARVYTDDGAKKSSESSIIAMETVQSIKEMNDSSKKVVDIISLIDGIAFQTNLLALNAAVEAARAGEQGRGFAVVAGEVRNLAQRSGGAAKEIEVLIKETVSKVQKSTDLVNKTSSALAEIESTSKTTAQLINEIAQASIEQKQGIDQINLAITEMDNMTQQNAAMVEETASASEEMANQAQDLLAMVQRFRISDSVREDSYSQKHHELHLKAAAAGKKTNGGAGIQPGKQAGNKTGELLEKDGFEKF